MQNALIMFIEYFKSHIKYKVHLIRQKEKEVTSGSLRQISKRRSHALVELAVGGGG